MVDVTLAKARTVIRTALTHAKDKGFKPLSVVVLDAGGHVVAFERSDGSSPGRFAIAHGKAYGAVMLGMPGTAQMSAAKERPYFMEAMNGLFGGRVVPVPGGVLIRDKKGAVIGAVGVTGDASDNDAEAALAGIAAAGWVGQA